MPKFVVDKSLFDPIEVEIGEKVYEAVGFSSRLIRGMSSLSRQRDDKKIDDLDLVVRQAALIFGTPVEEFEGLDVRAIRSAVDFVTEQLNAWAQVNEKAAAGLGSASPTETTDKADEVQKN